MDNDIEELFQKKKNKENEKAENNHFSYEDCSLQNNTISSTFITTRGRVNNRARPNEQKTIHSDNVVKSILKKENTQRLNAMKKCFEIVKNRNELNKIIMNSCKKVMSEDKTEKEQIQKDKIEINDKNILSNTSNSFFKRNVDNFINNYLKNSFYVNENVNTLNNTEKTEESKEEYQIKNITVNKNSSLCSLISKHIKDNNKGNKNKEKKILVDKNKKFKNNTSKNIEKLNIRKINTKKYINVNRMEQFKNKHNNNHNNNSFSQIKNMFNSKKEELTKNKSFCEKNNLKNGFANIKRNKLSSQRESMNININDIDFRPLNDKNIHSNKFLKNNISLKKHQYQNDGSNSIKINKRNNSNSTMVDKQKLKFRNSNPNKMINNNEFNRKNSINSENQTKVENKKNVNYMITSPTLYNTHIGFYFNSPNFAPFKKICINSPFNDNLTFNSLKEKINNLGDKSKTINVEKNNVNSNEEILKINQIYTKANDSKSIKNRKTKIVKRKLNSKNGEKDSKLHMNEDKLNNLEQNINKNNIINNSFNYFAQISNRDDCIPYVINHVETSGNNTTLEEKKDKSIRENFFDNIGLNSCGKKHLNLSNDIILSNNYKENNISKDIIVEEKNRTKKKENKYLKERITINNKINKKEFNKKLEKLTISKTKKTLYQSKPLNQELSKKVVDYKNKTSTHFFSSTVNNTNNNNNKDNKTNYNYDSLKRAPKLLREKHYSDFNNSLFDKSFAASRKIISNKNLLNRINDKFKSPNDNQTKLGKKFNNNKYNANNTNNNNIYKKPFSLTSARENNFENFYNSTNSKNEKLQSNFKKTNNTTEKVSNFYGNKRNLNKDYIQNKKAYFEAGSNNKNKNKNIKKSEKQKSKKNTIKEFGCLLGLNNINLNNFKIKSKPFISICKVKKYYHFAIQKDILGICLISKERKISYKNDKYIYKKQFSSSTKRKHNSTKFDMEKINGGICQLMINCANNKEENNKIISKDDQSVKYNTYNFNDNINQINNLKGNCSFKINKNTIKNQLNTNSTSILEYKDLNKKLNIREIKEIKEIKEVKDNNTNMNNNSLINYYDEDFEVTFGRRDQILLNKQNLSNRKKKSPQDKINCVNNNNIINNVFSYCNANEIENENNKELLDDESYVNGEVNYFNHTFHQSNQKCSNNSKIVYDFEINSITNNYYNNNNIILFSPQQKKLYFKYIEKGVGIVSNIFSNHRINIFKSFAYFTFIQKNKNKSESVIYMKKKLKDNGGKKVEANLTPSAKKRSNFIDNNINQDILLNSLNKEKNLYENKMSNFMKKIGNIRTKSSDYIILEKKDKSLIRKIDIESDDFNDINNNNIIKIDKIKKNESVNNNIQSYNTPRGFDKDEKNIVSPHFINNNEINVKRVDNMKKTDYNEIFLEKNNLKMFHCTPKFCQIKPKFIDDIKIKEHLNDNDNNNNIKKSYSLQEIFYIGSNSSLCFKENCLSNNFLSHCEEMLNYVDILEINKYDETDEHELNNNEKQNYSKYEILFALNKITELNFENVLENLNNLMINDNNNQYTFIKIIINKVIKEKKYIILYAKLCCCLYNDILKIINNYSNDEIDCNQNLGFDNDLKNILINECKLKFNSFFNEINKNDIQNNTNDIKNQLYNFTDFVIELINFKLISFDNVFYYLEKLYKEYIDNNNGNNISILYLEEILYFINIIMKNINYVDNKSQSKLKKFLEEKIISILENIDLLQINIKYKIINIKEKIKLFFENKIKSLDSDFTQDDIEFCDGDIDIIINNILINNKKIQNIKLLLLNDLQNFLKTKVDQIDNYNVKIIHNWYIIDELLFEIHIDLADFILFYLEISKEINLHYKEFQREYFENALNYFIQYSLDDKKNSNQKILELLLNICWEKGEINNESYFENIGFVLLLLLNKNVISVNDMNFFINESDNIKQNISSIIKYVILIDNGNKGKYYKCFQNSNFFTNNKELFNKIENQFLN